MRKIQFFMKVLLFVTIALIGFQKLAYAELVDESVKEHYDRSKENKSEQPPSTKNETIVKESKNVQNVQVGITAWDIIKMIFATIFVIALLYIILQFINKRSRTFRSTQLIDNLGGTSLGGNRSVQLIKVGNQLLVVGVGEDIQLLKEITDEEEYRQIIEDYNNKMEQLVQPSDIVTKIIERTKLSKKNENEGNHFKNILKKQLDDMTKGRKRIYEEVEKKGSEDR